MSPSVDCSCSHRLSSPACAFRYRHVRLFRNSSNANVGRVDIAEERGVHEAAQWSVDVVHRHVDDGDVGIEGSEFLMQSCS